MCSNHDCAACSPGQHFPRGGVPEGAAGLERQVVHHPLHQPRRALRWLDPAWTDRSRALLCHCTPRSVLHTHRQSLDGCQPMRQYIYAWWHVVVAVRPWPQRTPEARGHVGGDHPGVQDPEGDLGEGGAAVTPDPALIHTLFTLYVGTPVDHCSRWQSRMTAPPSSRDTPASALRRSSTSGRPCLASTSSRGSPGTAPTRRQSSLAEGEYVTKWRLQSKRAQRYTRVQLFPSTFR
jgi:hypothetical protein